MVAAVWTKRKVMAMGVVLPEYPAQPPLPNAEAEAYAARALALSARARAGNVVADAAYGPGPWQRLRVHAPEGPRAGLPVVLFLHGGGWTNGCKEWVDFVATGLCPAPALVAVAGYRLAPEARHPAPLHDCIAATVALRALAPGLGGDPDRLILSGHSAGGQLAALMALRPDIAGPAGLPAAAIRACLPVSGMFDLRDYVFDGVLPATLASAEDMADASPAEWVANAACPFLIAWGAEDYPPIVASNATMVARLRAAGQAPEVMACEGMDHYAVNLAAADPASDWCRAAARLISRA